MGIPLLTGFHYLQSNKQEMMVAKKQSIFESFQTNAETGTQSEVEFPVYQLFERDFSISLE
jgi:hypothetical protein